MFAADSSNLKSDYSKYCGYRQAEICISNANVLNIASGKQTYACARLSQKNSLIVKILKRIISKLEIFLTYCRLHTHKKNIFIVLSFLKYSSFLAQQRERETEESNNFLMYSYI